MPSRRARIGYFLLIASTIMLAATWFVCVTVNFFWNASIVSPWQIIPGVLTALFVVTTILGRRFANGWLRMAYTISAAWLGLVNFGFFAAWACWITLGIFTLTSHHISLRILVEIYFGCGILVSIYGFVNASLLRVTQVVVKLPNLPDAWRNGTVAVLTDLHLGNVRGAGFVRRVVAEVQRLQPRAVFIPGDLFDGTRADLDALIAPLKDLSAPAGIYYVTGNHEEFTDRTKFLAAVARAGIRVLNDEKIEVDSLQLIGVHDKELHAPQVYRSILQRAHIDRNRPSVLLAHEPLNMAVADEEGVSAQFCGHTHGGQIWPWTLVAARVHRRFNHGLNRMGKMLVYTSYGAGTWGPPMRVGTSAEIVMVRFESGTS